MPVTAEFCEDNHVVVVTISDPWVGRDLSAIYAQERPYFDQAKHKIHTLVNLFNARQVPPGLIGTRVGSPHLYHPNRGQIVIVGANAIIRALATTAMNLVQFRGVQFMENEAEAWAYLRQLIAQESNDIQTEVAEIGEVVVAQR